MTFEERQWLKDAARAARCDVTELVETLKALVETREELERERDELRAKLKEIRCIQR